MVALVKASSVDIKYKIVKQRNTKLPNHLSSQFVAAFEQLHWICLGLQHLDPDQWSKALHLSFPHLTWIYWAAQNALKGTYTSVKEFWISRFSFQSHFSRVLQACHCWTWSSSKKNLQTPHPMSVGRHRLQGAFISQVLCHCLPHLHFPHRWLHVFLYVP